MGFKKKPVQMLLSIIIYIYFLTVDEDTGKCIFNHDFEIVFGIKQFIGINFRAFRPAQW